MGSLLKGLKERGHFDLTVGVFGDVSERKGTRLAAQVRRLNSSRVTPMRYDSGTGDGANRQPVFNIVRVLNDLPVEVINALTGLWGNDSRSSGRDESDCRLEAEVRHPAGLVYHADPGEQRQACDGFPAPVTQEGEGYLELGLAFPGRRVSSFDGCDYRIISCVFAYQQGQLLPRRRRSAEKFAAIGNLKEQVAQDRRFSLALDMDKSTGRANEVGCLNAMLVRQFDQRPVQQNELIRITSCGRRIVVRLGLASVWRVTEPGDRRSC